MMKSPKKIPNTQEIKVYWNKFQKLYSEKAEFNMLPFYLNLLNLSKIHNLNNKDSILELSIGSGQGVKLLYNLTDANIVGGELSDNMLESASERLSNEIKSNRLTIGSINNEDLSQFKDNNFKSIISNFSLHIVNDPLKMLKEAYRVLDKDSSESSVSFSVWGRPENNFFFTCIPSIFKELNINLPETRSYFHLNKKADCVALLKEAGFSKIFTEYVSIPYYYNSYEDTEYFLESPLWVEFFEVLDESVKSNIRKIYKEKVTDELNKSGRIMIEALIMNGRI